MSSIGVGRISALQFGMSGKNKEIHLKRKLLFNDQAENFEEDSLLKDYFFRLGEIFSNDPNQIRASRHSSWPDE